MGRRKTKMRRGREGPATRFSYDVFEMFYGPRPPRRDFDFNLVRTSFDGWLRTWKMVVPFDYAFKADLMKFGQKTRAKFEKVVQYEIQILKSVKTQFAFNVR